MRYLIFGGLLFAILNLFSSDVARAQTEVLQSPYFIDAIHCEGLNEGVAFEKSIWGEGRRAELGKKAYDHDRCEQIFAYFGIEKFTWVTPEDLETVSFKMDESPLLASAELSIKKSELKNHVHVFAKFEQLPTHHLKVANNFELQAGGNEQSDRKTNSFQLEYTNKKSLPLSEIKWGVLGKRSYAEKAFDTSGLSKEGVVLDEKDQESLAKKDHTFIDLYMRGQNIGSGFTKGYKILTEVHLFSWNDDSNVDNELDTMVRFDWQTESQRLSLLGGSSIGPAILIASYPKDQIDPEKEKKKGNIVFGGLSLDGGMGTPSGTILEYDAEFFWSIGADEHHHFNNIDVFMQFGYFFGLGNGVGVTQNTVLNAILPQHRFGFSNVTETKTYYRLSKTLLKENAKHQTTFDIGFSSYDNSEDDDTKNFRESLPYAKINYEYQGKQLAVGLGLTYQAGRTK